jgi:hypothetical protein
MGCASACESAIEDAGSITAVEARELGESWAGAPGCESVLAARELAESRAAAPGCEPVLAAGELAESRAAAQSGESVLAAETCGPVDFTSLTFPADSALGDPNPVALDAQLSATGCASVSLSVSVSATDFTAHHCELCERQRALASARSEPPPALAGDSRGPAIVLCDGFTSVPDAGDPAAAP